MPARSPTRAEIVRSAGDLRGRRLEQVVALLNEIFSRFSESRFTPFGFPTRWWGNGASRVAIAESLVTRGDGIVLTARDAGNLEQLAKSTCTAFATAHSVHRRRDRERSVRGPSISGAGAAMRGT